MLGIARCTTERPICLLSFLKIIRPTAIMHLLVIMHSLQSMRTTERHFFLLSPSASLCEIQWNYGSTHCDLHQSKWAIFDLRVAFTDHLYLAIALENRRKNFEQAKNRFFSASNFFSCANKARETQSCPTTINK